MNAVLGRFTQPEALSPYSKREKQRGAQPSRLRLLPTSHHVAHARVGRASTAAVKHWQQRAQLGQLVGIYSAKLFLEPVLLMNLEIGQVNGKRGII